MHSLVRKNDAFLDFVLVGAPRSGTTWLSEVLRSHPGIHVPRVKELRFFNEPKLDQVEFRYERGIDFYRRFFEDAPSGAVRGELTPTYYLDPGAADRIRRHFPDAKILFQFRNPADVVYSTYLKLMEFAPVDRTFEAALRNPDLIELGYYRKLMQPYLECFSKKNIYVSIYENVFRDPANACRDIYRFLGVDEEFEPPMLTRRILERSQARSYTVNVINQKLRKIANTKQLRPVKRALTRSDAISILHRKILELNKRQGKIPNMASHTRQMLLNEYRESVESMEQLLQIDLAFWKK